MSAVDTICVTQMATPKTKVSNIFLDQMCLPPKSPLTWTFICNMRDMRNDKQLIFFKWANGLYYDILSPFSQLRVSETNTTLQWRHNERNSISNHQPHDGLPNSSFRRRSKKRSKLRVTGLCVGNSPGPVNSLHKWPVTRKMFPLDDVIMRKRINTHSRCVV